MKKTLALCGFLAAEIGCTWLLCLEQYAWAVVVAFIGLACTTPFNADNVKQSK